MRILPSLIIFFICSLQAFSQSIPLEKSREDLNFLVQQIKTYNPGLYAYNPEFDVSVRKVMEELDSENIPLLEHFKLISLICALSNEGHFGLGDWSDDVHKGIPENTYSYLPIGIRILNGRIFIWEDYSNEKTLSRGDEILQLNGKSSAQILKEFYSVYPSDGEITTYVDRTLEITFPWMYYFYIDQSASHDFKVKSLTGEEQFVRMEALTKDQQVENYRNLNKDPASEETESISDFYELEIKENHAQLTLKTFDWRPIEKYKLKSTKFYKSIFDQIEDKQVVNLVIDLRDNTGGRNEFADDMIPFVLSDDQGDQFLKKSISWEGKEKEYKMPNANKEVFGGKIYVLVNGRTYSAGSTLARYLKEYAGAIIIGEETGSRYEGYVAGSQQAILLPNSNIKIAIPRYQMIYPDSKVQKTKNQGVLPDHNVNYSIDDLIEKRDLHMEKAESLITPK